MATKKPTQLVINPAKTAGNIPVDMKSQLEARAARFGISTSSSSSPVNQEKLAARAARFADIKQSGLTNVTSTSSSTSTATYASNPANAELLAKRAARFADIKNTNSSNKTTLATTNPPSKGSIEDAERLAKRAARFADIKAKTSK